MSMCVGPRFCCRCINDSDGRAKRYIGATDGRGQAVPPYRWECEDARACAAERASTSQPNLDTKNPAQA